MAEAPDINVDELRRRARRRLIGAVVLALAAAVVVPMLLESDPKPLGEDVSVKIPQQDNDKFVNRLSDKSAKTSTAAPAQTANR
jgi:DedD protein